MHRITTPMAIFGFVALLTSSSVLAEPSLDEKDTTTITVNINRGDVNEKVPFQVFRDGQRPGQFYYMPDTVRLFERDVDGKQVPQFTMLKYDFTDPRNPAAAAPKGGTLQFAATMGAPPDALKQIKQKIPEAFKLEKDALVQLASIPIKSAKVALYSKVDGKLVSAVFGEGTAPLSDTQRMIFQLEFPGEEGLAIYDALTKKGQNGVGVVLTIEYLGLTPEAKVKITGNYRRIAEQYSKNEKTKATTAVSGFWSRRRANAEYAGDFTEARDELTAAKALNVDVYGNEKITATELNEKFVAPALAQINQEILNIQTVPEKLEVAQAKDPVAAVERGYWGVVAAIGRSVTIKKIANIRDGNFTVDFKFRDLALRQTIISGYIGVQNYPEKIRETLFITATRQFKTAGLMLPPPSDEFTTADMTTWVKSPDAKGEHMSKIYRWKSGSDSWKIDGRVTDTALFPFTTPPAELDGKDWTKFELHYRFSGKTPLGQDVTWEGKRGVLNGETRLTGVSPDSHHVLEFDWSELSWAMNSKDKQPNEVSNVCVDIKQGGRRLHAFTVRPSDPKGQPVLPRVSRVYCPVGKGAVLIEMEAVMYNDKKEPVRKKWTLTRDLAERSSVIPFPSDFVSK